MSVLINGMKMPQACWCCPITKCEHCMHFYAKSRPTNCPLVELPPHGRLIDADDFFRSFPELIPYEFAAPTIIPAEEDE